jgi:hypothetical protein
MVHRLRKGTSTVLRNKQHTRHVGNKTIRVKASKPVSKPKKR